MKKSKMHITRFRRTVTNFEAQKTYQLADH